MPNKQMLGEEQNESRETSEINVFHGVRFPLMGWIAGERQCLFQ